MSDYAGLDYGLGTSNIDTSNGIRYGVISQHSIMPEALDDMEMYYGEPHCPVCGNEALSIPSHTEQSENGVACYSDVPPEMEDWPNYSTHGCADYSDRNRSDISASESIARVVASSFETNARTPSRVSDTSTGPRRCR